MGKTTLAYELAAALGGVLVDLDWDAGGATRMWGFDPLSAARAPLLDALERGPEGQATAPQAPPQPARARCPLTPTSPPAASTRTWCADCLGAWAAAWAAPYVVVDTHPGANPLTDGAMQVADLVVVPVVLGAREMDALEAIVADYAGYRLLLVPTMVPAGAAAALRRAPGGAGRRPHRGGARRSPSTAGSAGACAARRW